MRKLTFFTILLMLGLPQLSAQVVINEFSASNLESFTDNFGKTEDWIELYNTSSNDVDISGCACNTLSAMGKGSLSDILIAD